VLQIGNSLATHFGGTAAACAQLANHLAACGVDVSMLTLAGANGARAWPLDPRVVASSCRPIGLRRIGYCPDAPAILGRLPTPDVAHIHGLWRLHLLQSARFACDRGIPVIVSAHGMLHAAALRQRAGLKRVARWLFQDAVLTGARCLHATAPEEAGEIRRLGFGGPVAVVPWGVDMPDAAPARSGGVSGGCRRVLYLGRLHPSKGLEPLVRAWARLGERRRSWRLVLAGYDEGSYRARLETLAAALGLGDSVTFAGAVEGAGREQLFAGASVVVLPSPAENFGFVVPEALGRCVPVIATHGSPWSRVVAEGCGWWVPSGEASLAAALAEALGRAPEALREMGERGRRFAHAHFAWDRAAADMVELYEWMLGRRQAPAFVERGAPRIPRPAA